MCFTTIGIAKDDFLICPKTDDEFRGSCNLSEDIYICSKMMEVVRWLLRLAPMVAKLSSLDPSEGADTTVDDLVGEIAMMIGILT